MRKNYFKHKSYVKHKIDIVNKHNEMQIVMQNVS